MTNKPRCVFDTNTLISAVLIKSSTPSSAFRWALQHSHILFSLDSIEELSQVIYRPKFDRYIQAGARDEFIRAYIEQALLIEPAETIRVCRDPKDDKFLELAVAGDADYIVTGDEDLLVLHPFRSIQIYTPGIFLDAVRA